MLRPMPGRILRWTATFMIPTGVDTYQKPVYDHLTVNRVALQPVSRTVKTKDNTEVDLNSILFIDGRLSYPAWPELNIWALKERAEGSGHSLCVEINGRTFTVVTVDMLFDDTQHFHHWEVGLI